MTIIENLAGQGMRKKYCIITMRARDLVSNPVYVVYSIYGHDKGVHSLRSLNYTRQSGIWPDISREIFSRAEGECKYTSEMSGHITR